jgi:hypothetical protein
MPSNRSKIRDKSSGDGITSYRITSYLTLSHATINRNNPNAEIKNINDPLSEGVIIATDLHGSPIEKKIRKRKKNGKIVRIGPSPVEKLKTNIFKIKEILTNTISYPFRIFAFYLDQIIENIALITQNMGAILALAYKAVLKQIKESPAFKGEEIYEPEEDIDENENIAEDNQEKNEYEYSKYDSKGNKKVSFLDLHELNINFTDNKNIPLFYFDIRKTQSYRPSPAVVDPIATRAALQAIKECAQRAASIPPAMEGPYANIPLSTVLENVQEDDLQNFLRYVKVYPGNYVGRNLKISETFATWVVYGAPTPN